MSLWKSLVMTLRVNHWEARFIFVLSQQTAQLQLPTFQKGCFWLPAIVPSQYKVNKAQPATQISPWVSDTHILCTDVPFQGYHMALPQNPPALPVASVAPMQEVLLFQVKQPRACSWCTPQPMGFVSLSGALQPLACSQL